MNHKRFFLHKGYARVAEISFIAVGLVLLFALGHAAVLQVEAREQIVGIQEMLRGKKMTESVLTGSSIENQPASYKQPVSARAESTAHVGSDAAKSGSVQPVTSAPVNVKPGREVKKTSHAPHGTTPAARPDTPDVARNHRSKL